MNQSYYPNVASSDIPVERAKIVIELLWFSAQKKWISSCGPPAYMLDVMYGKDIQEYESIFYSI